MTLCDSYGRCDRCWETTPVLLVGVDLVKDPSILTAAYDDSGGVTARFNRNALLRINRELRGNFDVEAFSHLALWNAAHCRMKCIWSVARIRSSAPRATPLRLEPAKPLHTENSHKFTVETFTSLAADGGWSVSKTWLSEAPQVALFRLEPTQGNR